MHFDIWINISIKYDSWNKDYLDNSNIKIIWNLPCLKIFLMIHLLCTDKNILMNSRKWKLIKCVSVHDYIQFLNNIFESQNFNLRLGNISLYSSIYVIFNMSCKRIGFIESRNDISDSLLSFNFFQCEYRFLWYCILNILII